MPVTPGTGMWLALISQNGGNRKVAPGMIG
jgi:hypothetical protein